MVINSSKGKKDFPSSKPGDRFHQPVPLPLDYLVKVFVSIDDHNDYFCN